MTNEIEPTIKSTAQRARRSRYIKRSTQRGLEFHKSNISKDFPEVFGDWKTPKPLAIGAAKQLKTHYNGKCPSMAIQCFLSQWVKSFAYQKNLIKGNLRYNIDGSKSALIDEGSKEAAQMALDKMKIKADKKHKNNNSEKKQTEKKK